MHSKTLSLRTAAICLILCLYNLCSTYPVFAQQASRTVTGKVLDENKQPMPGVAILIVGTTSGVLRISTGILPSAFLPETTSCNSLSSDMKR